LNTQDCIFHLLSKASRSGVRHWKETVADLGITAVQAKVVNCLGELGDTNPGELSDYSALDNATLTGLLDRLEDQKLLKRIPNPEDRRGIVIRLTPAGQKLATEIKSRMLPANQNYLNKLTDTETMMLKALLKKL